MFLRPCFHLFSHHLLPHWNHLLRLLRYRLESDQTPVWRWNVWSSGRIDPKHRTRAVDIDHAKTANTDTSSRRLGATHRETRDDDSEGFRTSSICQNGGECAIPHNQWICCGRKQFYSFMQRRSRTEKFSKNEITGSSHRWCQDWTSDWNRSIQICRNVGVWSATTVTTTRIWKVLGANLTRSGTIRTTMYSNTDWPQTSCGRAITAVTELRATASTGNQWQFDSQIQSCAKVKAHINWFQSTSLDIDASNSVNEKRLRILRARLQAPRKESTSWRLSWSWRIMSWRTWQVLSKLSIETEMRIAALGCSADKPRMEYCDDHYGNDYLHSCSARTQSWCQNQSNFIPLTKIRNTYSIRAGISKFKSIFENGLSAWG